MAQYTEFTDGVSTYRDGVRNTAYVIDVALTATGFAGSESIYDPITETWGAGDWRNTETTPPVE